MGFLVAVMQHHGNCIQHDSCPRSFLGQKHVDQQLCLAPQDYHRIYLEKAVMRADSVLLRASLMWFLVRRPSLLQNMSKG